MDKKAESQPAEPASSPAKALSTLCFIIAVVIAAVIFFYREYARRHEYAYLAPWVRADTKWSAAEYYGFISACNDKHVVELAIGCKVDGVKDGDLDNPQKAIERFGGRAKFNSVLQCDILWGYSSAMAYPFKGYAVPYDKIAKWVAYKFDVEGSSDGDSTIL